MEGSQKTTNKMTIYYQIAGLNLKFHGDNTEIMQCVRGFCHFVSDECEADIEIEIAKGYRDIEMENLLYSLKVDQFEYFAYQCNDNSHAFRIYNHITGTQLSIINQNGENFATISGDGDADMVLFAAWLSYGVIALRFNRVAVHCSATMYAGEAVIFLGESGTGKSTHSRLWREHVIGAKLLNDDSPIIEVTGDEVYVHGSPWSGKTPCYSQEKLPLSGIVRLSQAPYNKITQLNTFSAFSALYPSCPPAFMNFRNLNDNVCSIISSILTTKKVWHLECLPDGDAVNICFDAVMDAK